MSASLFDMLVSAKMMPPPKEMRGRRIWDRFALDRAFEEMPEVSIDRPRRDEGELDKWQDVAA